MGGLPLASIRRSYLEETSAAPAYLDSIARDGGPAPRRGEAARIISSVATTVTWRLVRHETRSGVRIPEVLRILHPDAIPKSCFARGGSSGPPLQDICAIPWPGTACWRRLRLPCSQQQDTHISLHRLVQAIMLTRCRERADPREETVSEALNAFFPAVMKKRRCWQ